jgi:nucleotide-binding universal stress UspA family protein
MTFKTILVALDRSPKARLVFEAALEQASPASSQLVLVHILRQEIRSSVFRQGQASTSSATDAPLQSLQQDRMEREVARSLNWLELYCQEAELGGITTQSICRAGAPEIWICQLAQMWKADLIILGSRVVAPSNRLALGGVSHSVVQHAPCSVLIVSTPP